MSDRTNLFSKNSFTALCLLTLTLAVALNFTGSAMSQTKQQKAPPPTPKAATMGTTITVTIDPGDIPGGNPIVTPKSVSVGPSDEVEWICKKACSFTVVFSEKTRKPFKDRAFDKGKPKSGKPTGKPGLYKYSVFVDGGGMIDPDVIIK